MYPYMNEDVAWQRLQDLQREMENSRLLAQNGPPALARLARHVGARIWKLAATARPVRRQEQPLPEERDAASDAA
jgi:hypothetical protein